jgi:hypothetical protein
MNLLFMIKLNPRETPLQGQEHFWINGLFSSSSLIEVDSVLNTTEGH